MTCQSVQGNDCRAASQRRWLAPALSLWLPPSACQQMAFLGIISPGWTCTQPAPERPLPIWGKSYLQAVRLRASWVAHPLHPLVRQLLRTPLLACCLPPPPPAAAAASAAAIVTAAVCVTAAAAGQAGCLPAEAYLRSANQLHEMFTFIAGTGKVQTAVGTACASAEEVVFSKLTFSAASSCRCGPWPQQGKRTARCLCSVAACVMAASAGSNCI